MDLAWPRTNQTKSNNVLVIFLLSSPFLQHCFGLSHLFLAENAASMSCVMINLSVIFQCSSTLLHSLLLICCCGSCSCRRCRQSCCPRSFVLCLFFVLQASDRVFEQERKRSERVAQGLHSLRFFSVFRRFSCVTSMGEDRE